MQKQMRQPLNDWLHHTRLHLARPDALLLLALLGLITGVIAGAVIVVFRILVESTQGSLLPGNLAENYEGLPALLRFLLPVAGGLLIGLIFHHFARGLHVLGIARLIERLAYHQGHLGLREFLLQFFGAAVAIGSGHSVGREGPHVFLGAAAGSLLGQHFSLPNNSIRTMVGCGTAAGIAASFNTPLAGVIFALEVVMMEYTPSSFIPIILAAVGANGVAVYFLGSDSAFSMPHFQLSSIGELGVVALLGIVAGSASALFIQLVQKTSAISKPWPFWARTTTAGALVGGIGLFLPQVLGIGYDTVQSILLGELGMGLLILLVLAKIFATSASIGMGIPGGIIGPALFIGAAIGGIVAELPALLFNTPTADPGFYALIGMGAMMGASLQAPLAALTAIIELTNSPQVVMPGMLAIVIAGLTSGEIFQKKSLFIAILESSGLNYRTDPVMQSLRRIGVASVMSQKLVHCHSRNHREALISLLAEAPEWFLVESDGTPSDLIYAADLARYAEEAMEEEIDLMEIPARRLQLADISLQATLQEAVERLDSSGAEALYVARRKKGGGQRILGVLTREQIESAYRV
ncbi:chloride channel protein [Candidatus Endoriftia persephone]|jgi:H+/Cl- antiporter ClcA|uniref:Chloride channel protein n=3 Tax=Gammaproteobacteria TaxID=1236 RepID=A0A9J6ZXX0_9GAMM|nr:chloride channel protein [Candidatus Endoriftia persephone]EGV49801.1 putative chloride channel protein ClcB [endosymbiont of Riftia pachyptila (vent Ph05)]USF87527.1 chloride channel protein [Candidatus Endoriftia persephone]